MMKNKELRELSREDILSKYAELKKELLKLNIQVSTKTALKNPGQLKSIKKTIARILTEINTRKRRKRLKTAEKKAEEAKMQSAAQPIQNQKNKKEVSK